MKKVVFVINGRGGVGKDTLCDLAAKAYSVKNVSSITPIKELAAQVGWQGEKTDRARKFLSDLKALAIAYNDFPTAWAREQYRLFLEGDEQIMFVHIREGEEIRKFVDATGGRAITLLVRGGHRFHHRGGAYGNAADDDVEKYRYDHVVYNDHPLSETERVFVAFLSRIMRERGEN